MSIFPVRRGSENPGSVRVQRGGCAIEANFAKYVTTSAGMPYMCDRIKRRGPNRRSGELGISRSATGAKQLRAEPKLAKGHTSDHQAAMSVHMRIVCRGGVAR